MLSKNKADYLTKQLGTFTDKEKNKNSKHSFQIMVVSFFYLIHYGPGKCPLRDLFLELSICVMVSLMNVAQNTSIYVNIQKQHKNWEILANFKLLFYDSFDHKKRSNNISSKTVNIY